MLLLLLLLLMVVLVVNLVDSLKKWMAESQWQFSVSQIVPVDREIARELGELVKVWGKVRPLLGETKVGTQWKWESAMERVSLQSIDSLRCENGGKEVHKRRLVPVMVVASEEYNNSAAIVMPHTGIRDERVFSGPRELYDRHCATAAVAHSWSSRSFTGLWQRWQANRLPSFREKWWTSYDLGWKQRSDSEKSSFVLSKGDQKRRVTMSG